MRGAKRVFIVVGSNERRIFAGVLLNYGDSEKKMKAFSHAIYTKTSTQISGFFRPENCRGHQA